MFNQSFQDQILKHLKGQCTTIKKREKDPNVVKDIRRKIFNKSQSSAARKCKFEYHTLGQSGQIYECDLEGRTVVVKWNIDHPFYQRFALDQRSDDRLVTAVDYLICSMASAELYSVDEDNLDLFVAMKTVMSANVKILLI